VRHALSRIGYPDEVAEVIAFVFNDTLICDDAASSQAVTFARNVGVRSVTLDGDVYEPSGTMSGGAAPSRPGVLVRAQELRAVEERVEDARRVLEALEREEARTCGERGLGEPACANVGSRSLSYDCCRNRLAVAMPRGYVVVPPSSQSSFD